MLLMFSLLVIELIRPLFLFSQHHTLKKTGKNSKSRVAIFPKKWDSTFRSVLVLTSQQFQLSLVQLEKDSKLLFFNTRRKGNQEYSFHDFWVSKGAGGLFVPGGRRPRPGETCPGRRPQAPACFKIYKLLKNYASIGHKHIQTSPRIRRSKALYLQRHTRHHSESSNGCSSHRPQSFVYWDRPFVEFSMTQKCKSPICWDC